MRYIYIVEREINVEYNNMLLLVDVYVDIKISLRTTSLSCLHKTADCS